MARPVRVTWTGVNIFRMRRTCASLFKLNALDPTCPAILMFGRSRTKPEDNWLAIRFGAVFRTVRIGDAVVRHADGSFTVEAPDVDA